MEESHSVTLTRMMGGKVLIHVICETQPEGFESVTPDLFDVYLTTVRKNRSGLNNFSGSVAN